MVLISRVRRGIPVFQAPDLREHCSPVSYRSSGILDTLTNESSDSFEGFNDTFDRKRGSAWDIEVVRFKWCSVFVCVSPTAWTAPSRQPLTYQILAHDRLWRAFKTRYKRRDCARLVPPMPSIPQEPPCHIPAWYHGLCCFADLDGITPMLGSLDRRSLALTCSTIALLWLYYCTISRFDY